MAGPSRNLRYLFHPNLRSKWQEKIASCIYITTPLDYIRSISSNSVLYIYSIKASLIFFFVFFSSGNHAKCGWKLLCLCWRDASTGLFFSFFRCFFFFFSSSTNDFLLFDPFTVSVFVQHVRTKAVTSHLFTPLFMFIHLPLIHFAPPPRLLIDFKNSTWLKHNNASYYALLGICYCFSHLIGLFSVTWSFTLFLVYFLFLSDEGPTLETLDFTIHIGSTPTFLYFNL